MDTTNTAKNEAEDDLARKIGEMLQRAIKARQRILRVLPKELRTDGAVDN